jgi:hypothetical protein
VKTTVEISDPLLRRVCELAAREGHPANAGGTRTAYVVAETKSGAPFRLRRARFKGKGPQFEYREASWDGLRDLTYLDRGA